MSTYIRHVSVYTGPDLFPKLKSQYLEAWERMEKYAKARKGKEEAKYVKILRDEDFDSEDSKLRPSQLHSHLLFAVEVEDQDASEADIIDQATTIISHCIEPKIRNSGSCQLGNHPQFDENGNVMHDLQVCEWSPMNVELQFLANPRSCAEDADSRLVRRKHMRNFGDSRVSYHRDKHGDIIRTIKASVATFYDTDPNLMLKKAIVINGEVTWQ